MSDSTLKAIEDAKDADLVKPTGGFTLRGSYIIGQALAVAISVMETEEYPEESNINDMKLLRQLFMWFPDPLKAGRLDRDRLKSLTKEREGER